MANSIRHTTTDDWIERFGRLVDQYNVDIDEKHSHSKDQTYSRLRIAILDTGIDMNHPEIFGDERIKAHKSWTGTSADEDTSGHGTHIASTILSLTKNVDVYIAKITENNVLEDTDRISDVGGSNILMLHIQPGPLRVSQRSSFQANSCFEYRRSTSRVRSGKSA